MFASSNSNGGGGGMDSLIPGQQDESVCAQCGDICPKLSYQQRLIGFASCVCLGYLMSILGTLVLFGGASSKNIRTFVVLYLFGNIIAICATMFLMGPGTQCQRMWLPKRRYTTSFYLVMLIVVFAVAITGQNVFLVLFLLVIEIMAATWYMLSWVPFARKVVIEFFRSTGICAPCFYVHDQIAEQCKKQNESNSGKGGFFKASDGESSSSNGMFGSSTKEANVVPSSGQSGGSGSWWK